MPKSKPKTKAAAVKRKKNAPLMTMKPGRGRHRENDAVAERRERIAKIRARTAAGFKQLHDLAAGADVSDLAHLPVVTMGAKRKGLNPWRKTPDRLSTRDDDEREVIPRVRQEAAANIYLPKRSGKRCPKCKRFVHPDMSCKDLSSWLATAKKVLSGKIVTPDEWPRFEFEPELVAPTESGRRRGRPPRFTLAEEADEAFDEVRTTRAA